MCVCKIGQCVCVCFCMFEDSCQLVRNRIGHNHVHQDGILQRYRITFEVIALSFSSTIEWINTTSARGDFAFHYFVTSIQLLFAITFHLIMLFMTMKYLSF